MATMPRRWRSSTATPPTSPCCAPMSRFPHGRALAILEHDVVLLLSPGDKKIKSLAELKKRKIAVWADSDNSASFVRNVVDATDGTDAAARVQMAPPSATLEKLFASGYGAVVALVHASK